MEILRRALGISTALLLACAPASAQSNEQQAQTSIPPPAEPTQRIVTPEEVERATHPRALLPLRVISYPHRIISAGLEKGLIKVERERLRERLNLWIEQLHKLGFDATFGGLGEGAGFGGGTTYTIRPGRQPALELLGRASFSGYQEFDARWTAPFPRGKLELEASYHWRPQENFYGLGHQSLKSQHSSFALRQSWAGLRWEIAPVKRVRVGSEYKVASLRALRGRNSLYPSSDTVFLDVAGFGTPIRLQSLGAYFDTDLFQGEYLWGATAHAGASYQDGFGGSELRYFRYETQLEGRMPMVRGRSVMVAQASAELTRERTGSSAVSFYLLPHVGGSSTLRGFALDRFYGRNLVLASFEYRYRLHPNMQALVFFDEGQIFNHTRDLTWLNWHRNYGLGIKLLTANGPFLRLEYGYGREGFAVHISFGDRDRRPLGGAIRYGTYRP